MGVGLVCWLKHDEHSSTGVEEKISFSAGADACEKGEHFGDF